jgi:hypothetical protein
VERLLGRERDPFEWHRLFHRCWGSQALGPWEEGPESGPTPENRDPGRLAPALLRILDGATEPLARQGLIFHLALALPPEVAFPRLHEIRDGPDSADAEDALCALAFRGDPDSLRSFLALATAPAPGWSARLAPPAPSDAAAREPVRAWKCVETLLGAPYFHDLAWSWLGDAGDPFPWGAGPTPGIEGLEREVLPAWLRRYPGHPGSDDMAWRLARNALRRGESAEALRWASRGACLPDQDMTRPCVELLVSLAERAPWDTVAPALLPDPEDPSANPGLLAYLRARRLAAERGFAEGLAEAERVAASEPDLDLSRAFRARRAEPPPRGLDSGAVPLPPDDPLRIVEGEPLPDTPASNPAFAWRGRWRPVGDDGEPLEGEAREEARLRPRRECVLLPLRRLAVQLRCWEAIAELERRAAAARSSDLRADLLYKTGAILYHQKDSLWPLYAQESVYRGSLPDSDLDAVPSPGWLPWAEANLPRLRAARVFEAVRDGFPSAPVADRASFSAGLARVRASQERPFLRAWDWWSPEEVRLAARGLLRSGVEDLERCARERPGTPLARDAAAAAAWWRRNPRPVDRDP